MKGAAQVNGDDGVPALHREVLDPRHVLDAGVVDQNIHPAKLRRGKFQHVFNFGRFAHVSAVVSHFDAQCRDFGLGAFNVSKTVEHDVGTLGGQGFGQPQTDAAGGSGDERCFTF